MTKHKIAFQGEPGANSHLAIHQTYPDAEAIACPTFEDAFTAIAEGNADLGMIPIENSVAGRVADIHHLMPASGLHIIAEHFMPVRHQLMAPKGATLKGLAKEVEGGKTFYEAETVVNGRTRDLLFDATGHLVEVEEETAIDAVPAAVKTALMARGKILRLETLTKGTSVTYEAQVEKNGKKSEVQVDADGKLLKK